MSLLTRLARRLFEMSAPVPPIFDGCSRLLSPEDGRGDGVYWCVAGTGPSPDSIGRAADILGEAIERNPWLADAYLHSPGSSFCAAHASPPR